jgi:hypothetical protein
MPNNAISNSVQSTTASTGLLPLDTGNALTPDAMLIYLQQRLGGIDEQIAHAFSRQKASEAKRKDLMAIQTAAKLGSEGGTITKDQLKEIDQSIDDLAAVDSQMAENLKADLEKAGIEFNSEGNVKTGEDVELDDNQATAFNDCIGNRLKEIGASAELDMIELQTLMGQRQTAISLATNLCAQIGKSLEGIVENCR